MSPPLYRAHDLAGFTNWWGRHDMMIPTLSFVWWGIVTIELLTLVLPEWPRYKPFLEAGNQIFSNGVVASEKFEKWAGNCEPSRRTHPQNRSDEAGFRVCVKNIQGWAHFQPLLLKCSHCEVSQLKRVGWKRFRERVENSQICLCWGSHHVTGQRLSRPYRHQSRHVKDGHCSG